MKKRAALIVFLSALHFGLVGLATVLGHATPTDILTFTIGEQRIGCGAEVRPFNIVVADIGHQIFCNLTGMEGHAIFAGWSPDGTRVAVEAGGTVYIADSRMREVARFTQAVTPSWSVSGILLFRTVTFDIATVDQNGNNRRSITESNAYDVWPSWSPDGNQIVFACDWDVCIVTADGQDLRQLTTNGLTRAAPRWCRDGQEIVFGRSHDIYILNTEGDMLRLFSPGFPVFDRPYCYSDSPFAAHYVSTPSDNGFGVIVINTENGESRLIFSKSNVTAYGRMVWSPDGSQLAFDLDGGVYIADFDSAEVLLVCEACDNPVWVPDLALDALASEPYPPLDTP